ncbi:MAG: dTDP-glucose 4,6-dehydratase [candidate division Zixibacteria bacterium]
MDTSRFERIIAITGAAGFIGSNLAIYLVLKYPDWLFVNIDSLTYAGNLSNLAAIESADNYCFEKIDIVDFASLSDCFKRHEFDSLIHLAAETHVDRSILGPANFVSTNIVGTFNLLEAARARMATAPDFRFVHVSTDEVFGSAAEGEKFHPDSRYRPQSPYAASKAAADHSVRSYFNTYGLKTIVSNCSNNYGPYQFPEKLIPLVIHNALSDIPIPIYGDGLQVRDWLYVSDHCRALDVVLNDGKAGETYLIGGGTSTENIDLVRKLCQLVTEKTDGKDREHLIEFVADRPGHDRRYAVDTTKIRDELGWQPLESFDTALASTVDWYLANTEWVERCVSGEYRHYYKENYVNR